MNTIRQGANHSRRPRGRGGNNGRKQPAMLKHQTFDSNGPEVRVRGNAHQIFEKYISLARDATSNGDRINAESYFQHAEHYFRMISSEPNNSELNNNEPNNQSTFRRPIRTTNNTNGDATENPSNENPSNENPPNDVAFEDQS